MAINALLHTRVVTAREQKLRHRVELENLPTILRTNNIRLAGAATGGSRTPAIRAYFAGARRLPIAVDAEVSITATPLEESERSYTHRMVFSGLRRALETQLGSGGFGSTSNFIGTELALLVKLYPDVSRVFAVLNEQPAPVDVAERLRDDLALVCDDQGLQRLAEETAPRVRTLLPSTLAGVPKAITKISLALVLLTLSGDQPRDRGQAVRLWSDEQQRVLSSRVPPMVAAAVERPALSKEGISAFVAAAVDNVQAAKKGDADAVSASLLNKAVEVGESVAPDAKIQLKIGSNHYTVTGKEGVITWASVAGLALLAAKARKTFYEGSKAKAEASKIEAEARKAALDFAPHKER